jgi:PPP family 3-phenylpropionic acid transporter
MTPPAGPGCPPAASRLHSPAPAPLRRYAAVSLTYFAAIGLFNPYAPLWFQSLGFSTLTIGAIASVQSWTRIFGPYAWSWFGDHTGRRAELIRLAVVAELLASLGLLGVQSAVPVALVTGLLFLANSGVVPLSEALLAQAIQTADGKGLDPSRYGRVRMWGSVGFIVAVSAFGMLLEWAGIGVFPAFVAAMNTLLLLAALRLPATHAEARHEAPAPPVWPVLRRPEVAWFFASAFFTVLGHTSLYTFLSLFLVSLGYGKAAVGALWAVSVVGEIAFFWTQGYWFARLSAARWLQLAAGVAVLRFAATATFGDWWPVLVGAQLLHAITFAGHHAACISHVQRHFSARLRGRGQALYTTLGYGASGVLGGVGGGWLVSWGGFAAVFWAASACAAAGFVCAWCAARPQAQAPG